MKVADPPAERRLRVVPPPPEVSGAGADPRPPADPPVLPDAATRRAIAGVIEGAIAAGRVLHVDYVDRHGSPTRRTIEPVGFVHHREQWFLLAWCRTRDAARTFRLDRVVRAVATGQTAANDEPAECLALALDIPEASQVRLTLP